MDFGTTVKNLRKAAGYTQRALAGELGVDFTYISKIENGKLEHLPSEDLIKAMARLFGVYSEWLLEKSGKIDFQALQQVASNDPDTVGRFLRRLQSGNLSDRERHILYETLVRLGWHLELIP